MSTNYERSWENKRQGGRSVSDESRKSYYGIAPIRKPHWKWMIIWYFFLGGISGASYAVANFANWIGGTGSQQIVRTGRYLSFLTIIPSTLLLIADLKKPNRFLLMLRILKLRSPMSVGSWGLTFFGMFSGISAVIQAVQDGWLRLGPLNRLVLALPARAIGTLGGMFGFFVAGYTGVLLAATAVPLWGKNALLMGPLFLSSALSNATAAIVLILSFFRSTSQQTLKRLEHLDIIAMAAELGILMAIRANTSRVIGRPLTEGKNGMIHRWGVLTIGMTIPALLQIKTKLTGGKPSHFEAGLNATLVLIGGFLMRYVMVMGGRESADDPQATFEYAKLDGQQPH